MYPAHRALIEICRAVRPPRPVASLEIQLARRYADWYVNTVKRDASLAEQDRTARELVADIHTKHAHQYFDEGTLADRECCIAINRDLGFATAPENDLWMNSINTQWLAEAQAATTAPSALAGFQLVTSVRIPPKIAHYSGSQLDAWLKDLPPCPDLKQTVASHVSCYFFPWTQHRKRSGPGGQARIALLDRTTVSPTHVQCRSSDILLNVVADRHSTALLSSTNTADAFNAVWASSCALAQLSGASIDKQPQTARMMTVLQSPGLVFDHSRLRTLLTVYAADQTMRLQCHFNPDTRLGARRCVCVISEKSGKAKEHDRAVSAAACNPKAAVFFGNFWLLPHQSEGAWAASLHHCVLSVLPWITCYNSQVAENEIVL